jgi:hypothetical protein
VASIDVGAIDLPERLQAAAKAPALAAMQLTMDEMAAEDI